MTSQPMIRHEGARAHTGSYPACKAHKVSCLLVSVNNFLVCWCQLYSFTVEACTDWQSLTDVDRCSSQMLIGVEHLGSAVALAKPLRQSVRPLQGGVKKEFFQLLVREILNEVSPRIPLLHSTYEAESRVVHALSILLAHGLPHATSVRMPLETCALPTLLWRPWLGQQGDT